ncbi:hypothetical protein DPMN_096246 [Dreissena polymorpha]|uniref:Uncharacterized protein n=1 Tax=Dreissena polymorpha TaxID=45954 RepID=A0A9D4L9J0_DREPO|nr:hypothetical protein DPMN_096246 [Dreissena polymorpha]
MHDDEDAERKSTSFGTDIDNQHSTFEYRAWTNVEPALTSTFDKSPEYRSGTNVEQALKSTFGKSFEYRAGANVVPALTSTFGKSPEYRAGANVEPALSSIFSKSPESQRCMIGWSRVRSPLWDPLWKRSLDFPHRQRTQERFK